ncbi:DNA topoisomerase 2-alpha-like [Cyclopterus lumpus]|uniref:DNA topoisomerase 2-alpha-like n=1 Tax=Cyclopterus lumpus TaxID=8103 RepID=UPI001486CA5E|nr:DNA topoisomerase 2-alpha-like [Cyclopterus lumpus]
MQRHRIPFKYSGPEDDEAITLAFSKKKVDERKVWLTNFMVNRRQRRAHNLPEEYLYSQSTKSLSYNDFVNKELVLFSNSDNERSIPCLVDGLKPGQRKVLFSCFKRNDKREVKVAQLAGSVAEMSAYHHGEVSLMMTIVGFETIAGICVSCQWRYAVKGGRDSGTKYLKEKRRATEQRSGSGAGTFKKMEILCGPVFLRPLYYPEGD